MIRRRAQRIFPLPAFRFSITSGIRPQRRFDRLSEISPCHLRESPIAPSALDLVQHGFDGVVVIDINLPGLGGIAAIRQMKRILPELPIVVLSFQSDVRYLQESFKAGATGFVLKERAFEDLPEAIRSVACNGTFIGIDIVP